MYNSEFEEDIRKSLDGGKRMVEVLSEGEKRDFIESIPVLILFTVMIGLILFGISSCNPTIGVA